MARAEHVSHFLSARLKKGYQAVNAAGAMVACACYANFFDEIGPAPTGLPGAR